MRYNLFLDDFRVPRDAFNYTKNPIYNNEDWLIVRDYTHFVEVIRYFYKNHGILPKMISFDHDLADEHYAPPSEYHRYNDWATEQQFQEKTGYDCAKWFVNICLDFKIGIKEFPEYIIHSKNPTGAENINKLLNNYIKFIKDGN